MQSGSGEVAVSHCKGSVAADDMLRVQEVNE